MPLKIFQLFEYLKSLLIDVIKEMYFQLSVQRYVPWRYHLFLDALASLRPIVEIK